MKTVTLYIEPASLPLTPQLLHYIRHCRDGNNINIIAFQRLALNTDYINKANTAFIDNINNGLSEKLKKIAGFVQGIAPSRVEIHTNIHRERDILFPLMKLLASFHPLSAISLHLYDDGSGSLIERAAIESLDSLEFDQLMEKRKAQLLTVLKGETAREYAWNIIDNYIWHYLLQTRYYFITPRKKPAMNAFYKKLYQYVTWSDFTLTGRVTEEEKAWLLKLVNFPMALYARLTRLRDDPQSLLFITSYCLDPVLAATYHQRLLALIECLKASGKIPDAAKVVFKGHPENRQYNDALLQAIGSDVLRVPDAIPVEFLNSFDLLPRNIGGEFSSTFFCIEGVNAEFVILKGQPGDKQNGVFCDIARQYEAFDADKIIYL